MIKKISAILLIAVMSLVLLAGCGDPIKDDLQNFLNNDMTQINQNYEKIKTEASSWTGLEKNEDFISSLEDTLIPIANESLEKLKNIKPSTAEVTAVKDKYVETMTAYKEGFDVILEGFKETDESKINTGNEKVTKALELLNEYNKALEDLAAQHGLTIEY